MSAFYNQATLTYNNTTTRSNVVQGNLTETLSIHKSVVGGRYGRDDAITYAVSLVNSGNTAQTGVTLTDDLGAYSHSAGRLTPLTYVADSVRYFVNGAPQAAPAVTAGPPLTISGVSVPANGNAMILYTARANEYAPLGAAGSIANTVSASGGSISAPISDVASAYPAVEPRLSIQKSLSPSTVSEGDELTYTITLQNSGNAAADATENIVVSDTFDPILRITDVRFNGTPWSSPANYAYNAVTGEFNTVAGQISVPAATYAQNPATGAWSATPGTATLVVTGTI